MTDAVLVRRLDIADLPALLASDAFDNAARPDQARAFLAAPSCEIVGALDGGRLIGFASGVVHLHPDKAPQLFISEVGVDPPYRRRGIAERLVSELIAIGGAKGCEGVWVATEGDNAPARALYEKLGGRETRDVSVFDWGGVMDQ